MNIKMKIMLRAVRIRLSNNEVLEDILNSYPKLSLEEKDLIRNEISNENKGVE